MSTTATPIADPHPQGVEYGAPGHVAPVDSVAKPEVQPQVAVENTTAPPPAQEQPQEVPDPDAGRDPSLEGDDQLEVLMPSADPRTQEIRTVEGQVAATYVQKPLSYFRKMQFFKLLARGMKRAVDEGGAEGLAEIFGGGIPSARNFDALGQGDFDDAGSFMRFVLAVVEQAEDLMEDLYVVWLAVPPGQREWAKAAMRGDVEGIEPLSDEDGVDILKTFVVQNWSAMQAFFTVHARQVFEVARTEQRRISDSEE